MAALEGGKMWSHTTVGGACSLTSVPKEGEVDVVEEGSGPQSVGHETAHNVGSSEDCREGGWTKWRVHICVCVGQLTRPGHYLYSIHTQDKGKQGIEMHIEAVGPLHIGWLGARPF